VHREESLIPFQEMGKKATDERFSNTKGLNRHPSMDKNGMKARMTAFKAREAGKEHPGKKKYCLGVIAFRAGERKENAQSYRADQQPALKKKRTKWEKRVVGKQHVFGVTAND